MKKIHFVVFIVASFSFVNCSQQNTNFKITKNSVGLITKDTKVLDLESIYAQDSIVTGAGIPKLNGSSTRTLNKVSNDSIKSSIDLNFNYQKIEIYEKGGAHLLSLTPSKDTTAVIENIRFHDARYTTDKGITIHSTFKDIKDKYTIKKIITSMNNVVILLKETGLYFTIDKKELPASLRYDTSLQIEAVQIPDAAKIKYMMLAWE